MLFYQTRLERSTRDVRCEHTREYLLNIRLSSKSLAGSYPWQECERKTVRVLFENISLQLKSENDRSPYSE